MNAQLITLALGILCFISQGATALNCLNHEGDNPTSEECESPDGYCKFSSHKPTSGDKTVSGGCAAAIPEGPPTVQSCYNMTDDTNGEKMFCVCNTDDCNTEESCECTENGYNGPGESTMKCFEKIGYEELSDTDMEVKCIPGAGNCALQITGDTVMKACGVAYALSDGVKSCRVHGEQEMCNCGGDLCNKEDTCGCTLDDSLTVKCNGENGEPVDCAGYEHCQVTNFTEDGTTSLLPQCVTPEFLAELTQGQKVSTDEDLCYDVSDFSGSPAGRTIIVCMCKGELCNTQEACYCSEKLTKVTTDGDDKDGDKDGENGAAGITLCTGLLLSLGVLITFMK